MAVNCQMAKQKCTKMKLTLKKCVVMEQTPLLCQVGGLKFESFNE